MRRLLPLAALFLPALAAAQSAPCPPEAPPGSTCLDNPLGSASIPEIVGNVIQYAMGFIGALALLVFVYGGFLWLTSQGAADKIQKGKNAMIYAAIGLVIVFSSYALVRFAFQFFTR